MLDVILDGFMVIGSVAVILTLLLAAEMAAAVIQQKLDDRHEAKSLRRWVERR